MSIMNEVLIFFDLLTKNCTYVKAISAIAEMNESGCLFAAEVLWFKEQVGKVDTRKVLSALEQKKISHCYSDEVDALTFSFGDGFRSVTQKLAVLTMEFNEDVLIKLLLNEKTYPSVEAG